MTSVSRWPKRPEPIGQQIYQAERRPTGRLSHAIHIYSVALLFSIHIYKLEKNAKSMRSLDTIGNVCVQFAIVSLWNMDTA